MIKPKIFFLEPYPIEGPSSRYRVEQLIPFFNRNGIETCVRPFMSSRFYNLRYEEGKLFKKCFFFLISSLNRWIDVIRLIRYDLVFIHLEAYPIGPPFIEWIIKKILKKPIVYDLDDAIYMRQESERNNIFGLLKCRWKIKYIIKISDFVITCNEYLAQYVEKYNKKVIAIHTSVNTDKFVPVQNKEKDILTIGWIGSHSTTKYLYSLQNVLAQLSKDFKFKFLVIGADDFNLNLPNTDIITKEWSLKEEVEDLKKIDIGLYPLFNNEWVLGKTGFKTLLYMSIGIPAVVSNVGANKDIIEHGKNGFLVDNEKEWVEVISKLLNDANLRREIGNNGRITVQKNYSLDVNFKNYLKIFNKVIEDYYHEE